MYARMANNKLYVWRVKDQDRLIAAESKAIIRIALGIDRADLIIASMDDVLNQMCTGGKVECILDPPNVRILTGTIDLITEPAVAPKSAPSDHSSSPPR